MVAQQAKIVKRVRNCRWKPMSLFDQIYRHLPAALHGLMVLVSVPHVLVAVFFVIVGRVASQRGPWAIFDTFLNSLNWALTWGAISLGLTLLTIFGLGFFRPLQLFFTLAKRSFLGLLGLGKQRF
jgi:uncharacterized membrane protein